MLGDIKISCWVLVIPEVRTKELLKYCKSKEKQIPQLSYSIPKGISVKIETDDSFPSGSIFSRRYIGEEINIDISDINTEITEIWKSQNSTFLTIFVGKQINLVKAILKGLEQA
nr:hypothetical protein [Ningiella sp. W23]